MITRAYLTTLGVLLALASVAFAVAVGAWIGTWIAERWLS